MVVHIVYSKTYCNAGLQRHQKYRVEDPIHEDTMCVFRTRSTLNTKIYNSVFTNLPDKVRKLSDLLKHEEVTVNSECIPMLADIQGYIVDFPTDFLTEEQMSPTIFDAVTPDADGY